MAQPASTHVMLYMSAQNELASKATENINAIKSCCNLDGICTYVMLDTIEDADPENLGKRKTFQYRLPPGATDEMFTTKRIELPRDKVVTRPEVFQIILESAYAHFEPFTAAKPPRQKILIFWGHGGGMVMLDENQNATVNQSRANLKQFADMLVHRTEKSHPLAFDVVAFDSCYMCMIETMHELRNGTQYVLCSSTVVDDDGFPYEPIFRELREKGSSMMPDIAAARIAALYDEHYLKYFPDGDRFLFVCDMKKIKACAIELNALGQLLGSMMSDANPDDPVRKAIRDALIGAGVDTGYVYVLSFLRKLAYTLSSSVDAAALTTALDQSARLRTAVNDAFKGNMGDSADRPISPQVWSPLRRAEFIKNKAIYNALECSDAGHAGWAAMWRRYHMDNDVPLAPTIADANNNFGLPS